MEEVEFWKMHGSGNDFILVDNRNGQVRVEDMGEFVKRACRRRESVGADGVIFVTPSTDYDFGWRYFNADGGEVEMCGNGGRCVSRFAFLKGIAGPKLTFETMVGPISAEVKGRMVKIQMPRPTGLSLDIDLEFQSGWTRADFVNIGVPHVVIGVKDLVNHPVREQGRHIRFHERFKPEGTNANFMKVTDTDEIEIRTYERGVEDETLACGTGAIAGALVASTLGEVKSPVRVKTKGGEALAIYFEKGKDTFDKVWLEGSTSIIYQARLHEEAI